MESLEIAPVQRIEGTVKLPGSKSLSNRILLLAALAEGTTNVQNLLVSTCCRNAGHAQAQAACMQLLCNLCTCPLVTQVSSFA